MLWETRKKAIQKSLGFILKVLGSHRRVQSRKGLSDMELEARVGDGNSQGCGVGKTLAEMGEGHYPGFVDSSYWGQEAVGSRGGLATQRSEGKWL